MNTTPATALAHNLRGFRATTLRVIVEEARDGHVWVRTADLLDAGTALVLNAAQVTPIDEPAPAVRHTNGLITLG
jgi:hypothetical protein